MISMQPLSLAKVLCCPSLHAAEQIFCDQVVGHPPCSQHYEPSQYIIAKPHTPPLVPPDPRPLAPEHSPTCFYRCFEVRIYLPFWGEDSELRGGVWDGRVRWCKTVMSYVGRQGYKLLNERWCWSKGWG